MFENNLVRLLARTAGVLFILAAIASLVGILAERPANWWVYARRLWELPLGIWLVLSTRKTPAPAVVSMNGPWVADAKRALAAGDKMGAITIVRNATSLGLAEAKRLVETWSD